MTIVGETFKEEVEARILADSAEGFVGRG